MSTLVSKDAESVQRALIQKGLCCTVVELTSTTHTAKDAAAAIGCEVGQIVKSLLFRTKAAHAPLLILASGKNRVDEKAVAALIGEKIEKAPPEFAQEVTGYAVGGIPPIGHKQLIERVFIDEDLLCYETIWAAAGTPFAVFSMPAASLQEATGGVVAAIRC